MPDGPTQCPNCDWNSLDAIQGHCFICCADLPLQEALDHLRINHPEHNNS